ncbi:hypothetical protein BGX38DRAFT_1193917 [Terfezia claveryi]|nr:hypothetical protein BGX38DRAFT_1193917 [Terfezia claveryi]
MFEMSEYTCSRCLNSACLVCLNYRMLNVCISLLEISEFTCLRCLNKHIVCLYSTSKMRL